jgi:hypothetical protein
VLLGRDVDHAQFAAMVDRARAGSPGSLVVEGVCGVASAGQDRDAASAATGPEEAESLRVLRSRVDDAIAAIAIPVPKTAIRIARYFQRQTECRSVASGAPGCGFGPPAGSR